MNTIFVDNYYYLVKNDFYHLDGWWDKIYFTFDNSAFVNKIDRETNKIFLGSEEIIKQYLEGAKIVTYEGRDDIYYNNKLMEFSDLHKNQFTVFFNGNYTPFETEYPLRTDFPPVFSKEVEKHYLKRPFGIKFSDEAFLFQTFNTDYNGNFKYNRYINLEKLPNLKKHHWTAESNSLTFGTAIPGKPQIIFLSNDKLWELKFPLGITPQHIYSADGDYLKKRLLGKNEYGDLRYITEPLLLFIKDNKYYLFIPQPFVNYGLDGQLFATFEYIIYEFGKYCCIEHCFNKNKN